MRVLVLIGFVIAVLFASFNLYSLDHITRITGIVTEITADSITVSAAQNLHEGITLRVMQSTLFIRGGQSASWRDLNIGAQADINAATNATEMYAINVVFQRQPPRRRIESSPQREAFSYDAYWRAEDYFETHYNWQVS